MSRAQNRVLENQVFEKHHIVPRSLGGDNRESNLTRLTPREHFVAHLLLVRMTNGIDKRKMVYAVICFKRPNPNHKREIKNSRSFENVKKLLSSLPVSKETGQKIASALKGKKRSPEVCAAISKAQKGKIVSDETRRKMSTAKIGATVSLATREKMSNAKKGKPFQNLETRSLIVSGIAGVDYVVPFEIKNDQTVNKALEALKPDVFTKGGDRVDESTIPEWEVCQKHNIKVVTGVGLPKKWSSSWFLKEWGDKK